MARVLLEMGVSPSQRDTLNQTTLYYASREGKNQLIDFLLEHGCNPNQIDNYGQSPIFYACREGKLNTVQKLMDLGANHDYVDNNGQTPVFYTIKNNRIEMVEYLLSRGIDVNVKDNKGTTPIEYAKRLNKQQIVDLLLQHGAKLLDNGPAAQKNKAKKVQPPPVQQKPKINERKVSKRYQLTVLKDGIYESMNEDEWVRFQQEHPEIARYFDSDDQDVLRDIQYQELPENVVIYDHWDKAAKRIVNTLLKNQQAWIFYEPVDPQKLNIPDYFDIVKEPMDLGTIKTKLNSNQYLRATDFIRDVQLMFDNCILYNGESTHVSIMCKAVQDEFRKQYTQLNFDYYL